MSLPLDIDRRGTATSGAARQQTRKGSVLRWVRSFALVGPLALVLAAPVPGSTPKSFDTPPDDLPPLTEEMAALDPLAAEARCRSFLAALYHRHRWVPRSPAWAPDDPESEPLAWVFDVFFALPPASPGVRAAHAAAGDLTRAYLDAFGPGVQADALPHDPLYRNDKSVCAGVLGLPGD